MDGGKGSADKKGICNWGRKVWEVGVESVFEMGVESVSEMGVESVFEMGYKG